MWQIKKVKQKYQKKKEKRGEAKILFFGKFGQQPTILAAIRIDQISDNYQIHEKFVMKMKFFFFFSSISMKNIAISRTVHTYTYSNIKSQAHAAFILEI